jgi:hypothetical protein
VVNNTVRPLPIGDVAASLATSRPSGSILVRQSLCRILKNFGSNSAEGVHTTYALKNMPKLIVDYGLGEEASLLAEKYGPASNAWHGEYDDLMLMTIEAVFCKSPEKGGQ